MLQKLIPNQFFKLNGKHCAIIFSVAIGFIFTFSIFIFLPMISDLSSLNDSYASVEKEYNRSVAELNSQIQRSPSSELSVPKAKVKLYDLPLMLKEITKNEKRKYFEVTSLQTMPQDDVSGLHRTFFMLEVESSFLKIGQFIEGLEKSDAIVEVRNINLTRSDGDLRKIKAQIELEGLSEAELQ